jgi:hypothetical protein
VVAKAAADPGAFMPEAGSARPPLIVRLGQQTGDGEEGHRLGVAVAGAVVQSVRVGTE